MALKIQLTNFNLKGRFSTKIQIAFIRYYSKSQLNTLIIPKLTRHPNVDAIIGSYTKKQDIYLTIF